MANQQELSVIDQFKHNLTSDKAQKGFTSQLPSDVPVDKFTAVVIRAVQEDPDLLKADRTSLFLACQRAAQDGLIPDKREGALVVFSVKSGDQWVKAVQWQPMIGGLRKRLAKCGFDLRAEVVYENDFFNQELGDDPTITHTRPALGESRGEIIGAYAIATHLQTGEKWREVMDIAALNEVRAVAKSANIWNKWPVEMYRKTVARKLYKYLPIVEEDERLSGLIQRDNENFDMEPASSSPKARDIQAAARKQTGNVIEHEAEPEVFESENPAPDEEMHPAPAPVPQAAAVDPGF